ncbi:ribonuclease HII [Mesomycoplasma lagogenitalium]|uniref:Ribonuclease n=1 Tax=Mesomycoplasma lagogenitalium TaxID=171286 RepID=A0ABY8LUX8_9BACT|nr:ribonuclease HII [Mesomycoplasma lagogenitalium]WGI37039.1 ribonuclease HII [Mesomycoplasma lagogenitalium]
MKKKFDESFINKDIKIIVGCDEVGRGCIAGPVVATCIILKDNFNSDLIDDSKKINKKKHFDLVNLIKENSIEYHTVFISEKIIDEINILNATKLAMEKSLSKFQTKYDLILTDYIKLNVNKKQENITKGDQKSLTIASASLISKYTRDEYMKKLHKKYPEYGFNTNAGYLTKKHKNAILNNGILECHRHSFEPIKSLKTNNQLLK